MLETYKVTDEKFRKYGRIVKDIDCGELIEKMKSTPLPEDVIYVHLFQNWKSCRYMRGCRQ